MGGMMCAWRSCCRAGLWCLHHVIADITCVKNTGCHLLQNSTKQRFVQPTLSGGLLSRAQFGTQNGIRSERCRPGGNSGLLEGRRGFVGCSSSVLLVQLQLGLTLVHDCIQALPLPRLRHLSPQHCASEESVGTAVSAALEMCKLKV